MILSEEEAMKINCKTVFLFDPRSQWYREMSIKCKASGCMKWKWWDKKTLEGYCGLIGGPDETKT